MSALHDALDILTTYTGMFLPEKFPIVQKATAELARLEARNKELIEELAELISMVDMGVVFHERVEAIRATIQHTKLP